MALAARAATFHRDVLPILERRCLHCHRPGDIGPMPLQTWRQARPWAKAIREAVVLRRMPPWFVAGGSLEFDNDPRLTAGEIATVEEWVRSGAPEGLRQGRRAPVVPASEWNIGKPDHLVTMPQAVRVPARQELDYQFVVLPMGLSEDRWARAVEIRPSARDAVHHVVAYLRAPGDAWLRDAAPGVPFARPGTTTSDILALYAPGQPPMKLPATMAKKVPAGSDLVLQIHYTPTGRPREDRTSVGIVWARDTPAYRVHTLQIATTEIRIPPGEARHRVSASGTLPNDALLLSLFPHMHLRGRAFEYAVIEPGGRVDTLLRVDPYRFEWQLSYRLRHPRLLRKGTRLRCTGWYDNSPNNPRNPDPAAEVTYGERSRDEMMVGFFDVAVPPEIDKPAFFVR